MEAKTLSDDDEARAQPQATGAAAAVPPQKKPAPCVRLRIFGCAAAMAGGALGQFQQGPGSIGVGKQHCLQTAFAFSSGSYYCTCIFL